MNGSMATAAQRNQVVRVIVGLILVDVMHMQLVSPMFSLFAAKLARPFVAILNLFAKTFPIGSVVPFGNTALPCWIVCAGNGATRDKRFGQGTLGYAMIRQCPRYCSDIRNKHGGDLFGGVNFGHIQVYQNVLAENLKQWMDFSLKFFVGGFSLNDDFVMRLCGTEFLEIRLCNLALYADVVTGRIFAPLTFPAYPLRWSATATCTQGRWAIWLIDRFAGAMVARLCISARLVAIATQQVPNLCSRAIKCVSNFFVRRVIPRIQPSPIVFANGYLGFLIKHTKGLARHIWARCYAMSLEYVANGRIAATITDTKLDCSRAITNFIGRLIKGANLDFLFWGEFSLSTARGIMGLHKKFTFLVPKAGTLARRLPTFIGSFLDYFSTNGLGMQCGGVA